MGGPNGGFLTPIFTATSASVPAAAYNNAALTQYDAFANDQKTAILNNTSLDSTSKQELLDMLSSGRTRISNIDSTNDQTYTNAIQGVAQEVQNQIKLAASDDPLYRGRRYLEEQTKLQDTSPGRQQTVLTQRDNTPNGTPTLITSGPGNKNSTVNLTTPGSILTGNT